MSLEGRVILLTGATGFIGGHLLRRLQELGVRTHILVRQSTDPKRVMAEFPSVHCHAHDGSIAGLSRIFQDIRPELVIHLASLFIVDHRVEQVDDLVESNVGFPVRLLEVMSQCDCRLLINTGTAWQSYLDEDFHPVNLYAATKQAFEDLLLYYVKVRKFKALTLRLFDTYGPGDTRQKLITLLCRIAVSGEKLSMSPGKQLIDLVHVEDVCSAYINAAVRMLQPGQVEDHEVFAVTSGQPLPLRDVVALFEEANAVRLGIEWGGRPYREREVMVPWRTGKALPGWSPQIPLPQGLKLL